MPDSSVRACWWMTLTAAGVLLVTMGVRQSLGLLIAPLHHSSGVDIVDISLALAVGQFLWGAIQPLAGAVADRYGPGRVLAVGIVVQALGLALTPWFTSAWGLVFTLGVLAATGSGAGSFSVLIGAAALHLPAERRGMASGVINAGGSLGQFLFAPLLQALIAAFGWMAALWSCAVLSLTALPLAWRLRRPADKPAAAAGAGPGVGRAIGAALADRSYLLLHAGFFTCGFHIAFLVTHLPGEVQLCGLPMQVAGWALGIIGMANIAGSLAAGWSVARYRSKYVLFWMYASRAVLVGLYLLAPKTDATFYLFAAGLGLTWLATVPPTAAIVGKLFGTRYLATLFGLTLLSHQAGGFLGAWLGGLAMAASGHYALMWYADIVLALLAALCNLPIREAPIARPAAAT